MPYTRLFTLALTGTLILAACGGNDPPPPPEPDADSLAATMAEQARLDSIAEAERMTAAEAADAERRAAAEAAERMRLIETLEALVFFEYDESTLSSEAERSLRAKVDILRANPEIEMRIEGHADERGSTEYNLALGQRRAEVVRSFFTSFGLDGARFQTVSFGEERPRNLGMTEDAWAENRRSEFAITSGRDMLRVN